MIAVLGVTCRQFFELSKKMVEMKRIRHRTELLTRLKLFIEMKSSVNWKQIIRER